MFNGALFPQQERQAKEHEELRKQLLQQADLEKKKQAAENTTTSVSRYSWFYLGRLYPSDSEPCIFYIIYIYIYLFIYYFLPVFLPEIRQHPSCKLHFLC